MKKNNAGFSLVELIVAIAILTVLTGVGAYGLNQVTGFRAREAADKITSSLKENKIETLGKAKSSGGMAWEIYRDGNDFFIRTVYDAGTGTEYYSNSEKINEGKVTVWVGKKTGGASNWVANYITLTDGNAYRIYFNRSTGALCDASGLAIDFNPVIRVKYGRKDYDVEVVSKTGKVISNTQK